MNYVAAHGTITLRAALGRNSVDVSQVVFEVLGPDGTVLDQSGPVAMTNRRASWQWTPNRPGQTTLGDDADTIVVSPRVAYTFDGHTLHLGLDDVTVFRDRVNIKVVSDTDEVVRDCRVRLTVHRRGIFTNQTLGSIQTDANGVAAFTGILRWTRLAPAVKNPWEFKNDRAPYKVGHEVGLNREVVVVPKKYLAAFKGIRVRDTDEFEPIAELGGQRKQFVNFEQFKDDQDTLFAGENESYYGFVITLKIGPAENPEEFANDYIYIKMIADPQNGKRTEPKPHMPGTDEEGIRRLRLGDDGTTTIDASLGVTGGDKFTFQVCSAKKFSTVPDEEFEVVNWRRLYREVRVPAAMTATLSQANLPESAGQGPHYDLPAGVLQHMKQILDPLFIDYRLSRSQVFANDKAGEGQLVPAAFFERDDGRSLYVGSYFTQPSEVAPFTSGKDHTIYMTLFDFYFDSDVYPAPQSVELDSDTIELEPSSERRLFLAKPEAVAAGMSRGANLVTGTGYFDKKIKWTALVDPEEFKDGHPGLDEGNKPRTGELEPSCASAVNHKLVRITLPKDKDTDPGSFVGSKGSATCPIKLEFKINEVMLSGGGDLNGSQVIFLHPRVDVTGTILCHELGHAIGMTPIGRETMRTLPGLDTPKHVDEGGTYYRHPVGGDVAGEGGTRSHGQGPHCAHGLPDMTIQDYPLQIPDGGCVMYAYAPNARVPYSGTPYLFCDTCKTLIQAETCVDVH